MREFAVLSRKFPELPREFTALLREPVASPRENKKQTLLSEPALFKRLIN
ncbi:hypothetical protein [Virgibacillus sp. L01]